MSIPFNKLVVNECGEVYIVDCFEPATLSYKDEGGLDGNLGYLNLT